MNAQMMTYTLNSTVGCCDADTVSWIKTLGLCSAK